MNKQRIGWHTMREKWMWTSDLLNNTKIDWLSHSSFLLAHRLSQWLLANIKKKTKWRCKCVSSQFIPRFMSNNWKGAIFHAQKVRARRKNQRKKCALAEKCNRMEYVKRWLLCRITFGRFESIRRRETAVFLPSVKLMVQKKVKVKRPTTLPLGY